MEPATARLVVKPGTATGRKVVAIYGDQFLDDVLGIEHEVVVNVRKAVKRIPLKIHSGPQAELTGRQHREAILQVIDEFIGARS